LHCPSCGESCKKSAKFCPNCGTALTNASGQQAPDIATRAAKTPVVPLVLSVVAVVGLFAVAITMSFIDDAPGDIGSPVAMLFHSVGTVEFILGLAVLTSTAFVLLNGIDVGTWGSAILALGLVSVAATLLIVAEGTFAVIFLAIPGLLAVAAGLSARRRKPMN
jgi:hypothetical protein